MNRDMNTRALKRSAVRTLGVLSLGMAAATTSAATALADEPVAPAAAASAAPTTAPAASAPPALPVEEVKPAKDPTREASVEPKPAEPRLPGRVTLDSDPVADGAIIAVSFGAAGLLDLINSTGEIRPQQISPNFDRNNLLTIDRGAISQTVDSKASGYSSIGLFAAVAYAVIDPIASGFRESSLQTGLVDAISLTYALTNLTKMAIRRPRPQAYIDAEAHKGDPNYSNADTDSALSFISGHASITTAIGATATYLAFTRSPHSVRPWITLILATGLSTFVSVERVRAGAHFPTDVIAGCIAGAGIGVLVPHLHRTDDIKQRRVWVGFAPTDRGQGGTAQVSGLF